MQSLKALKAYFTQVISRKKLSHAYLFTGDDLDAKRDLTLFILQILADDFSFKQASSGKFNLEIEEYSISDRIRKGVYPDILVVKPDGNTTKVDQVRQLRQWVVSSPIEGVFKCVIIEQAETMNQAASNALLTYLEEPVDGVYYFLYAPNSQLLLPTITSRTQEIIVPSKSVEERLADLLNAGISREHALVIASLSPDSAEEIVEVYDSEEFESYLQALRKFYQQLINKDLGAFVSVQTDLREYLRASSQKEGLKSRLRTRNALDGLDYLYLINHQLLLNNSSGVLAKEVVESYLEKFKPSTTYLLRLSDTILEQKEKINANVSPQLVYEQLCVRMLREK